MVERDKQVVAFRISKDLLSRFDQLAGRELRARGNQMEISLMRLLHTQEALEQFIEYQVKQIHKMEKVVEQAPDENRLAELEYCRGQLHAAKMSYALVA